MIKLGYILLILKSVLALFPYGLRKYGPFYEYLDRPQAERTVYAYNERFYKTPDEFCQYNWSPQFDREKTTQNWWIITSLVQAIHIAPAGRHDAHGVYRTTTDELEFCCGDMRVRPELWLKNIFRSVRLSAIREKFTESQYFCWYRLRCPAGYFWESYVLPKTDYFYELSFSDTRIKWRCKPFAAGASTSAAARSVSTGRVSQTESMSLSEGQMVVSLYIS